MQRVLCDIEQTTLQKVKVIGHLEILQPRTIISRSIDRQLGSVTDSVPYACCLFKGLNRKILTCRLP